MQCLQERAGMAVHFWMMTAALPTCCTHTAADLVTFTNTPAGEGVVQPQDAGPVVG